MGEGDGRASGRADPFCSEMGSDETQNQVRSHLGFSLLLQVFGFKVFWFRFWVCRGMMRAVVLQRLIPTRR